MIPKCLQTLYWSCCKSDNTWNSLDMLTVFLRWMHNWPFVSAVKKLPTKAIRNETWTWDQCSSTYKIKSKVRADGLCWLLMQAQAIPVIMSGRDCIGIAMTGSGKTLAYVLPMLRHIKAQKALERGDGPISLIMGPTRELVHQIGRDVKKYCKSEGLQCVTVYGGSGEPSSLFASLKCATDPTLKPSEDWWVLCWGRFKWVCTILDLNMAMHNHAKILLTRKY